MDAHMHLAALNFEISSNAYYDISNDLDIGKVDENYLYETLSSIFEFNLVPSKSPPVNKA